MEKPSLIEKLDTFEPKPRRLLGIFVKEPVAGRVKTRLCPPLQPKESARLYEIAMRETIDRFSAADVPVVLFYAGSDSYFQKKFPSLPLWPQSGDDLGARMNQALTQLLTCGCDAAVLIGSDSPDLPERQVSEAFAALQSHDAVVVPAADGGYVLVGVSTPCPELFRDIPWSTGHVLAMTRQRSIQHGIAFREIGGWQDIDDSASLKALVQRSPQTATARFVRDNLQHCL